MKTIAYVTIYYINTYVSYVTCICCDALSKILFPLDSDDPHDFGSLISCVQFPELSNEAKQEFVCHRRTDKVPCSFLWDIGKQNGHRCDATRCGNRQIGHPIWDYSVCLNGLHRNMKYKWKITSDDPKKKVDSFQ